MILYDSFKIDKELNILIKKLRGFKPVLRYPRCFTKRENWLIYSEYLQDSELKKHVQLWFTCNADISKGGFDLHFEGDYNDLVKSPLKLRGNSREKYHILNDLLRRCTEGTLIKCNPGELQNIVPLFLIEKWRNVCDKSKGKKFRCIFNHSVKIGNKFGLNHGVQSHNKSVI